MLENIIRILIIGKTERMVLFLRRSTASVLFLKFHWTFNSMLSRCKRAGCLRRLVCQAISCLVNLTAINLRLPTRALIVDGALLNLNLIGSASEQYQRAMKEIFIQP